MYDIEYRIRENTKLLLARTGRTQSDLAEALGLHRNTLSARLHGRAAGWTKDLAPIADYFDVDPQLLLADPDRVWCGDGGLMRHTRSPQPTSLAQGPGEEAA